MLPNVITNKASLIPQGNKDGNMYVMAKLAADAVDRQAVSVQYTLDDDMGLVWSAQTAFPTGTPFELFGVTLAAGVKDDVVPVAIYGQVEGVTLPAAVTGNAGLLRGGTRAAALATLVTGALNNQNGMVVAEITDAKTGSQNQRDLYILGKEWICATILRSTGRVLRQTLPLSQSLMLDVRGGGYLMADCSVEGVSQGRLTMFRRGRTTSWTANYNTGNLGNAAADAVFIYGVPMYDVTSAAGAVARIQVLGKVEGCDLGASVNVSSSEDALLYTSGNNNIAAGQLPARRAFAAVESGALRTRDIHLLGRLISN